MSLKIKTIMVVFLVMMGGASLNGSVFANSTSEIHQDDGGTGGGKSTTCDTFVHSFYVPCGTNGERGGGGSWRIYSTSSDLSRYVNNTNWVGVHNAPSYARIASVCPSSRFEWVAVYGWEGRNNRLLYGPLSQSDTSIRQYNTYSSVSLDDVINMIISGSVEDGTKLSSKIDADILMKVISGAMNAAMNTNTGYFCISQAAFTGEQPTGGDSDGGGGGDGGCIGDCCEPGSCSDEEDVCEKWKPASYDDWETSVAEGVRISKRISELALVSGTGYKEWQYGLDRGGQDSVTRYVVPTDTVEWASCYFPGVQKASNKGVSKFDGNSYDGHGSESSCEDSSHSRKTILNLYGAEKWKNEFMIKHGGTLSLGANWQPYDGASPYALPLSCTKVSEEECYVRANSGVSVIEERTNKQTMKLYNDTGKTSSQTISTPGNPIKASRYEDTSYKNHDWTCHCDSEGGCSHYGHTNEYYVGSATDGERDVTAEIRVPYNFVTGVEVGIADKDAERIYSGEKVEVKLAKVGVAVKDNKLTQALYATQVDEAELQLVAYTVSAEVVEGGIDGFWEEKIGPSKGCDAFSHKQCEVVNEWSGVLNCATNNGKKCETNGNREDMIRRLQYGSDLVLDDKSVVKGDNGAFQQTYNAFDASAGDYMCFRLGVFPATSGEDWKISTDYDGNWRFSVPSCTKIAKKPSFQAYGGSLYFSGGASTSDSEKFNLWDVYDYAELDKSNRTRFGSWVEQGIVANGGVSGLASGASLGYDSNSNNSAGSGVKGDPASDFCEYRVPLSFANYSGQTLVEGICGSSKNAKNQTGRANIQSNAVGGQVDKSALVDYWAAGAPAEANLAGGSTGLNDNNYTALDSASGAKIWYTRSSEDVTLGGGKIDAGVTRIIVARDDNGTPKNVTIGGNIIYQGVKEYDEYDYSKGSEVPQVVIYGNNISIDCNVTTIDAILIAEGTVNTCKDAKNGGEDDNTNSELRSHQLNIRGMVIANKLELNRTYGTAWGKQSNIPAETINYDTSTMLWGRYMAGSGESDTLTTVYQHEIAPRY